MAVRNVIAPVTVKKDDPLKNMAAGSDPNAGTGGAPVNPSAPALNNLASGSVLNTVSPTIRQGTESAIANNLSGSSYDATELANRSALQRNMQQATAQNAAANVGKMGQGDAAASQNNLAAGFRQNLGEMNLGIAQAKNEAANTGVTQAMNLAGANTSANQTQQQLDLAKQQYGDTQNWKAFENAANYGSDADVAAAYKAATGKDMDMASIAEVRGYARTQRAQTIETGDIQIEGLKTSLGDQKFKSISDRVGAGATREQINNELGTNLTSEEFASMQKASQSGQFYAGLNSQEKQYYDGLDTNTKLAYAQMSQQDRQFMAGLKSDEGKFFAQLNSTEQIAYKQMGQQDRQFMASLAQDDQHFFANLNSTERVAFASMDQQERLQMASMNQQDRQFYAGLNSTERLTYAQMEQGDRQFYAKLDVDERVAFAGLNQQDKHFMKNLELETGKLTEMTRQFDLTSAEGRRQFDSKMDLDYDQLNQQDRQFLDSLGLDRDKFEEMKSEWKISRDDQVNQFRDSFNLEKNKFAEMQTQFDLTSAEGKRQFNETMNLSFAQLNTQNSQFAQSLGLDEKKFNEMKSQWTMSYALQSKQVDAEVGIENAKIKILQSQQSREEYENAGSDLQEYMQTHLDATAENDSVLMKKIQDYYTKSGGVGAIGPNDKWTKSQVGSARDGRLTNPYDAAFYSVTSSKAYEGLGDQQKKDFDAVFGQAMTGLTGLSVSYDANGVPTISAKTGTAAEMYPPEDFIGGKVTSAVLRGAADPKNKNNEAYKKLKSTVTEWKPSFSITNNIENAPGVGDYYNMKGSVYEVTKSAYINKYKTTVFKVKDVNTGKTFEVWPNQKENDYILSPSEG